MAKKTIEQVRRELDKAKAATRAQRARAELAEHALMVERARAEAFGQALRAVLTDMKRLGLVMAPKPETEVTGP